MARTDQKLLDRLCELGHHFSIRREDATVWQASERTHATDIHIEGSCRNCGREITQQLQIPRELA